MNSHSTQPVDICWWSFERILTTILRQSYDSPATVLYCNKRPNRCWRGDVIEDWGLGVLGLWWKSSKRSLKNRSTTEGGWWLEVNTGKQDLGKILMNQLSAKEIITGWISYIAWHTIWINNVKISIYVLINNKSNIKHMVPGSYGS